VQIRIQAYKMEDCGTSFAPKSWVFKKEKHFLNTSLKFYSLTKEDLHNDCWPMSNFKSKFESVNVNYLDLIV
jgi:hypothetical protein